MHTNPQVAVIIRGELIKDGTVPSNTEVFCAVDSHVGKGDLSTTGPRESREKTGEGGGGGGGGGDALFRDIEATIIPINVLRLFLLLLLLLLCFVLFLFLFFQIEF